MAHPVEHVRSLPPLINSNVQFQVPRQLRRRIGLNGRTESPMYVFGMATVLKHVLTLCLALAFLTGSTAQLVSAGMVQADIGMRADMAAGTGDPNAPPSAPCPGQKPTCIERVGCLTVSALTTWPAPLATTFRWTSVAFAIVAAPLRGISVKPELSPPILPV